MSRTTRLALVAACAAAAALTAGCAAGQSAATLQIHPNLPAAASGDLQAQDVVVVVDPATGAAQLTGTVVNDGANDDQLVGVALGGQQVTVNPVAVAAHSAVNLAGPNAAKIVLTGSTAKPGEDTPVTLTFAGGASVQLPAETDANTGIYAGFQPSASS